MVLETIDAGTLKRMFLAGVNNLEAKKAWINELNVFPVPDGDTGTNMTLTLMSAVRELNGLNDTASIEDICKKISMGTLKGARGNSGVIMSQLCRGFTKVAESAGRIDKSVIARGFEHAVSTAYKAVMKPKEGTILTVAKAAANKAMELENKDISMEEYFLAIIKYADFILGKTPNMLPVLKEAGVVDSGGQGLVEFMKGAFEGYKGNDASFETVASSAGVAPVKSGEVDSSRISTADIKFGYCTEFIIMTEEKFTDRNEAELKSYLDSIGDSIVVVSMDGIVKVHVHTNHPGDAFEKGLTYGQLTSMKVDNLWEEHNEKVIKETAKNVAAVEAAGLRKKYGFVAVCAGEGLIGIYKELGADEIISGGQTMNPSTEDIMAAIDRVNSETVFVLPNNSNIIMAAQQAVELYEGKNIVIIPTKTVVQGISALINFLPDENADENTALMTDAIGQVKTAEVTHAVRDTELWGKTIQNGDYMGIGQGTILSAGSVLMNVTLETIRKMADKDSDMITIFYGRDITEEDAMEIAGVIEDEFERAEVDVVYGGQPVYYYFISVE
ncbi:MAG: DAK2 domain-containing protein [Lachnospiraceae bacterium]